MFLHNGATHSKACLIKYKILNKNYNIETDYSSGRQSKPITPNHRFFASTSYETEKDMDDKQWKFDLTYNYLGEQRLPNTASNPMQYQLGDYSNGYSLLNFQVTKVFSKKFEIYVGGENITNVKQKNPILASDNPFGNNFDSTIIYSPIFGQMLYSGLRFKID